MIRLVNMEDSTASARLSPLFFKRTSGKVVYEHSSRCQFTGISMFCYFKDVSRYECKFAMSKGLTSP